VPDGVAVAVCVWVCVEVPDGVRVGLNVGLSVGVAVGVGLGGMAPTNLRMVPLSPTAQPCPSGKKNKSLKKLPVGPLSAVHVVPPFVVLIMVP
jgi:hypothetical protein